MTNITITIPDDRLLKLKELAFRFQLTPEELFQVSLEDLLARPDEALLKTTSYVLKKNTELYRR